MTLPADPAVHHLKDGDSAAMATLWKITKTNGTVVRTCNCDRQVVFEGELYDPDDSPNVSAVEAKEGINSHNRSASGAISSGAITYDDLVRGLYEGALVEEFVVDRRFSWLGAIQRRKYRISETYSDDRIWRAEVEGLFARMSTTQGDVVTRTCENILGDAKCAVDLSLPQNSSHALAVSDVSSPNNGRTKFVCDDALYVATHAESFSEFGFVEVLTGDAAGSTLGIMSESRSGSEVTFELYEHAPADLSVGDLLIVTIGCNRTKEECVTKFDNILNFGGFPFVPGFDVEFDV